MVALVAQRAFPYARRSVRLGDRFEACEADARILIAVGHAAPASADPPPWRSPSPVRPAAAAPEGQHSGAASSPPDDQTSGEAAPLDDPQWTPPLDPPPDATPPADAPDDSGAPPKRHSKRRREKAE